MKRLFIPLCLAVLVFLSAGCRKSAGNSGKSIEGAWELRKIQASLTVNYDQGNGNLMKFSANRYEIISNGQVTANGTYEIVNDPTVEAETGYHMQPETYTRRIIYDNNTNTDKIFIEITNISLTFFSGKYNIADSHHFTTYLRN